LTLYGDLDISVIDELPPGRKPIVTKHVTNHEIEKVYSFVKKQIDTGRQAYVVYPVIEESKLELKAAIEEFERLSKQVYPQLKLGLLHGRMSSEEKDAVMQSFRKNETQILVATTVIEVGVDVPNATVMVIEHAERFGLSQLHQLRGRVGRGAEQSYCVLLASDKQTDVARERLGIMEETNDGFKIAEKDLEIRGPGELMGTRQAGLPEFRVANLVRDLDILQAARREADYYFNQMNESGEAASLLERVRSDARLKLAAVG
jgi:ATP-dependent DNA helicase RecG